MNGQHIFKQAKPAAVNQKHTKSKKLHYNITRYKKMRKQKQSEELNEANKVLVYELLPCLAPSSNVAHGEQKCR